MKITAIRVYQIDLPLHEGSYKWSGGNAVSVFDSTVVEVETDAGITGWGEVCPLGPAYLPAYAAGARAGIVELAPHLIGADPTALGTLNDRMDSAMRGHPYVKSAIDMACWDILGKVSGLPVATLMGGRVGDDFALYRAISQDSPERMAERIGEYREAGYRKFQLKVGGDPDTDIDRIRAAARVLERGDVLVADANTGWTQHAAVRIADAVRDVDVYLEQPCRTYEECLAVRQHTNRPFVLDEVIDGIDMVVRGARDGAMDVINLKISKVGGLTKARQIRDLCVSLGLAMTIEDTPTIIPMILCRVFDASARETRAKAANNGATRERATTAATKKMATAKKAGAAKKTTAAKTSVNRSAAKRSRARPETAPR